jgi:hypothetical protein
MDNTWKNYPLYWTLSPKFQPKLDISLGQIVDKYVTSPHFPLNNLQQFEYITILYTTNRFYS